MYNGVTLTSGSDQSTSLVVTYWPIIGIPELFCDFNVNEFTAGENLAANTAMSTWSNGAWGQACGYYVNYEWKGTNGQVYFLVLSNQSILGLSFTNLILTLMGILIFNF